jgi:hypothetical protein
VESKNNHSLTFDDVIAASKPGVSLDVRESVKRKLENTFSNDEALEGVIKFLKNHNYNFDELYQFLDLAVDLSDTKAPRKINYRFVIATAASIVLVIGIVWLLLYKNKSNKEMTAAVFYEPGLPVFAAANGKKDFQELMSAYRMGDTKTGLDFYNRLIKKDVANDTLHYFGGWLFFMNKQPHLAMNDFKIAANTLNGSYRYKAEYMQAISCYIAGQKTESKQLFEKIQRDKLSPYQKDAKLLLSKSGFW